MSLRTTVKSVLVDVEAQTFILNWADGHQSCYPLDGLRRACPCVSCRGGHEQMGALPDPEIFHLPALQQWHAVKVEPSGSIGLRITWDDGHNTGIYTWERLRAMCLCDLCKSKPL